jgi:hypothetical protein
MYVKIFDKKVQFVDKYPLEYKGYNSCVNSHKDKIFTNPDINERYKYDIKNIHRIYDTCQMHIYKHIEAKINEAKKYCSDKDSDIIVKSYYCKLVKDLTKLQKKTSETSMKLDDFVKITELALKNKEKNKKENLKRNIKYSFM